MRFGTLGLLVALSPLTGFAEWTPPDNPNPQQILTEAQTDAREKRYDDALAKHVWIHEHSLEHTPAFYGVRLSFALMAWNELGKKSPPALVKLREIREQTAKKLATSDDQKVIRESFHDVTAIDRTLEQQPKTVELFLALEKREPKFAKLIYDHAAPALIRGKHYEVCGRYLVPETMMPKAVETYRQQLELAENSPQLGVQFRDFVHKKLTNDVTTLVALLVKNKREDEAEGVAIEAKKEWDEDNYHAAIDRALKGEVPDPWP